MEDYYNYFGISQDDVNQCRKIENEFYFKIDSFKTYEEKMNFKYELYRPSEDIVNDGMKTIDDYRFQEEPYKKSFTSNNKVYNKFINIMKDLNKNKGNNCVPFHLTSQYVEAFHKYIRIILTVISQYYEGYIIKIGVKGMVESKYPELLNEYSMTMEEIKDSPFPITRYILKDKSPMYSKYRHDSNDTEEETIHMEIYELDDSFNMEKSQLQLIEEMLNEINARNYLIISLQTVIQRYLNSDFYRAESFKVTLDSANDITIYFGEDSDVMPIKYVSYADYWLKEVTESVIKTLDKAKTTFEQYPTLEFVECVIYKEYAEMKRFYQIEQSENTLYIGTDCCKVVKYALIEDKNLYGYRPIDPRELSPTHPSLYETEGEIAESIKKTISCDGYNFHLKIKPFESIIIERRQTKKGQDSVVTIENTEEFNYKYL